MGAGRKAAGAMKEYLGIRDTNVVYLPEREGFEDKWLGILTEERSFTRIRSA